MDLNDPRQLSQFVQELVAKVLRDQPAVHLRPGTVMQVHTDATFLGAVTMVHLDGDPAGHSVEIENMLPVPVVAGQRVMVFDDPPRKMYILGTPTTPAQELTVCQARLLQCDDVSTFDTAFVVPFGQVVWASPEMVAEVGTNASITVPRDGLYLAVGTVRTAPNGGNAQGVWLETPGGVDVLDTVDGRGQTVSVPADPTVTRVHTQVSALVMLQAGRSVRLLVTSDGYGVTIADASLELVRVGPWLASTYCAEGSTA